jgi:predicted lipase
MDTYDVTKYDDILVTGHSLDQDSSIAAVEIATLFETKRIHLITFGAPRYGDKMFVQESIMKLADVARYVCGYDPIPFIPLMFSTYGVYWHLHGNLVRKLDSFWALCVKVDMPHYHRSERYLINLAEHLEQ